ncbi:Gfo/Idh/MocA family protein [Pedobacter ureilyticus]|uniref:Gfo/Idh/MocA family protein n=1 Tax=Pedobacter ureilyticus TaxID=1393051 RepID=A0ABW9J5Q3_9SPHI|nr:Gfo/Idh/MocA family oxidoreductase [Pedobacter helvus]
MKTIKFAVLGCGHIGKRHAEVISKNPYAELVATIDPIYHEFTSASAKSVHFQNLSDFFKQNLDIDVVNVCSPNGLHAKQAIQCLDQGCHVVVEKPIALNLTEANCILEAANRNQKQVFPVVQNRYAPTVQWLKQLVEENALGKIYMIQMNCFWNRDDNYYGKGNWHGKLALDGGPLYTQFSHFIDLSNWIFGKMENIDAKFYNFNHQHNTEFEDSGIITFEVNGGAGTLSYTTSVSQSNFESSITVIAEHGTVKIAGQYMDHLVYCQLKGDVPAKVSHLSSMIAHSHRTAISNHQHFIDNVVNVLNGLEKPKVQLQEGIAVVDCITNIYQQRNTKKIKLAAEKSLV